MAVVGTVLLVVVRTQTRELGVLLSLACGILLMILMGRFLDPILETTRRLNRLTGLSGELIGILLKAAGVSLLCEIACSICEDAGEAALSKGARICGSVTILYLSLPLLQSVLDLIEEMLRG